VRLRVKLENNPNYAWMSSIVEMERSMASLKVDIDTAHNMVTETFTRINKDKSTERDKSIYQEKIFYLHGEMKL
jgi:hypothetical protein